MFATKALISVGLMFLGTTSHSPSRSLRIPAETDIRAADISDKYVALVGTREGGLEGGLANIFVSLHERTGRRVWFHELVSDSYDEGTAVALDQDGGVLVGGETFGRISETCIGSAIGCTKTPSVSQRRGVIAKFSREGRLMWSRELATTGDLRIRELEVDTRNHNLILGVTNASLDGFVNPSPGYRDRYLIRLDKTGRVMSTYQDSRPGTEAMVFSDVAASGSILEVGYGDGSTGRNPVATRYDVQGKQLWQRKIKSINGSGLCIGENLSGEILIASYGIALRRVERSIEPLNRLFLTALDREGNIKGEVGSIRMQFQAASCVIGPNGTLYSNDGQSLYVLRPNQPPTRIEGISGSGLVLAHGQSAFFLKEPRSPAHRTEISLKLLSIAMG